MGNSFPSKDCIHDLGNASIVFIHKEHRYLKDENMESWIVSYEVGWSSVGFILERTFGKDGDTKFLRISIVDPFIDFVICRAEKDLLHQIEIDDWERSYETNFVNETSNHWGGVTKTNVLFHGNCQSKGELVVVEQKRKKGDEKPCMVTLTHYYAVSTKSFIRRKKIDVGLSLVVDIRVSNNDLVVSMKGPDQHPSLALLSMFQQVSRTWIWNPMACSHCAAAEAQRQHSGVSMSGMDIKNQDIIGNGNGNIVGGNFYNNSYYHYNYAHQRQPIHKTQRETDDTETYTKIEGNL